MSRLLATRARERLAVTDPKRRLTAYACALEGLVAEERADHGPWWEDIRELARDAVVARLADAEPPHDEADARRRAWAKAWLVGRPTKAVCSARS